MKSLWTALVAIAAFVVPSVQAQPYPMPKSVSDPLVICSGCPGKNRHGELNDGLPIEPYGSPVAGYVGRFIESTDTGDYQQPFRTARAGRIRVAPQQRGSAPPRVYSQIGSALGVFSLSNFYTQKIAASTNAMGDVHNIVPYQSSLGRTSERVARPDAIVYAEVTGSGWMTSWEDGQQRLFDFDFDDRGYVYLAYEHFGWGIVQDDGRGSGAMLPLVSQQFKESNNILPMVIISLKSGQQYYSVVAQPGMDRHALYNVTQAGSPGAVIRDRTATIRTGPQWGIRAWSKDDGQQRIAYVTSSYTVRVMSYANFISGGAPIAEFFPSTGRGIFDVSFDEQGDIWMAERSTTNLTQIETNVLRKATPSGSNSYTQQTYNVYGSSRFSPTVIHAAAGFVVVAGRGERESGIAIETRILKISGGEPTLLDDGNYFRRVYGFSRRGYAMPAGHTGIPSGVLVHRYDNKTYFLYSLDGIGDVYELSGEPPPPCTSFSISPTSAEVLSSSGSQPVSVIGSPSGCAGGSWSASSTAGWLTVSPASGSGGGSVSVSWTSNSGSPRSGTATIAGNTFTVDQKDLAQSACTSFSISPTSLSVGSSQNSQNVTVTGIPLGCIGGSRTASTSETWLSVTPASDSGSGLVSVSWEQNGTSSSRSGSASIAGSTLNVNQAASGSSGGSCTILPDASLITINATPCTTGCSVGQSITFSANVWGYSVQSCDSFSWNFGDGGSGATGQAVSRAFSQSGTYQVRVTLTNNMGSVVSQPVAISVGSGTATCTSFDISPPTVDTGQASGSRTISVTGSPSQCTGGNWSAISNANWIGTAAATGSGSGSVNVNWNQHSGEQTRSGTVAIAGRTLTVNQLGSASPCGALPPAGSIAINATCTTCQIGQEIIFFASIFGQSLQACDTVTWDFGDGSPKVTAVDTSHVYTNSGDFVVTMTISNSNGSVSTTRTISVPGSVPVKPLPVLTFSSAPTKASKGVPVTFTVESNFETTTGWSWDFGDGTPADNSQAGVTAKSSTRTHTFASAGPYTVTVKARNSEDVATAQSTIVSRLITIEDIAEFRYLLPAVIHMTGANQSLWRTDVQIYNPDPNVTENPLKMTASFKEINKELEVVPSTFVYEDFLAKLLVDRPADQREEQGPVIITVQGNYPPQIWTRTYNQAPDGGTFGQFIPAIRLDEGGGAALGEGLYFLAGLRQNTRYRTNIGLVNPNAAAITATLRVFDDTGTLIGDAFERQLNPFQLDQFSMAQIDQVKGKIPANRPFSVEINIPAGLWVVAYASFIDGGSNDPTFLQAVRQSELASADYRNLVVPGVGHFNAWRSDVTIFNPSTTNFTVVDLTYRDSGGAKVGEAKTLLINKGEFLQYDGLLKQGIFGSLPDSIGMLHIDVAENVSGPFPMAFARTYNDDGSGKTYGQGIGGFASARANVKPGKPGLIPSVRSDESYYTNVGLTNLTGETARVRVSLLDQMTGAAAGFQEFDLAPYQSIIRSRDTEGKDLIQFLSNGTATRSTLKIELLSGSRVWAYASVIDRKTNDPEYVPATVQQ